MSVRTISASQWLIAVIAIAGLIFLVRHFAQFQEFMALLNKAEPVWLIVALGLQAATYASVASGWNAVLRRASQPQPLRRLIPIAISKLFADQAIPGAGLGGNVLLVERLNNLGTSRGSAMAALLVSTIGYYASYSTLAMIMLLVLRLHRQATPLLTGLVTMLLMVSIAIPSLALWLRNHGNRPLPAGIERIGPLHKLLQLAGEAPEDLIKDRALIAKVTAFNALVFVADAATLAVCLLAVGQPLELSSAFVALMCGSIAMTLSLIPMGLGTFEATCIGILTLLGIAIEPAIAATLLLRGFTLWLPLGLGLIFLHSGRKKQDDSEDD
ncbi:MAG: lysylphosphatidylglycerol synthase transmembrane domain-containing protein [Sphingorhabdus sp.]